MAQRIHNLSKWIFLKEGSLLRFSNEKRRLVCLDVNCPTEVCFYVIQSHTAIESNPEKLTDLEAGRDIRSDPPIENIKDDGTVLSFLGLAKGRDRFEFNVDGAFDLLVFNGSAYVSTADGQEIATQIVAPVIFTRIANRRERNREIEIMMYKARENERRMYAQLDAEFERRQIAMERKVERYAKERNKGTTFESAIRKDRRPSGELEQGGRLPVERGANQEEVADRKKGTGKRSARATEPAGED